MKSWARRSLITLLCLTVLMNPVSLELIQAASPNEHATSERVPAQSNLTYTVDRLTDANSAGGGQGAGLTGDLRYAITRAQSGDRITFNVIGTVNLSNALPLLTQDVNIQGPLEGGITLRGKGNGNVLAVGSGTSIVFSNLTITGGVGNGGGIFNNGMLTLNNVTVSGNKAGDPTNGGGTGAGIWNYTNGALTLNNSTVTGNTVLGASFYNPSRGGGIANYGTLTLNNSTISGNSASEGSGGGISNTLPTSALTLNNSTISGNSATGVVGTGSGIDNHGTLNTSNTIIAGNSDDDLLGALISHGHNLIGNTTGGSGFRPDLGDLLNVNPLLGSLQNNGGLTQTHALLPGSPAIDAGDNATCLPTDQRGIPRPQDGDHDGTVICDIGTYELADTTQLSLDTTGVFRPSNGRLYLKNTNTTGFADTAINYGTGGDYPVTGDWDGNGTATIGIYRNGVFFLRNSNTLGFADLMFAFGTPGDQPIAGDWNDDGIDTIGVYRSSTGQFLLRNSNTSGMPEMSFYLGNVGDVGIAGDWNGDGIATTGVFRPSNGVIFLKNTNATGFANVALNYGLPGDQPVVGDWDNNGTTTIGIYRNAWFYLRNSNTNGFADLVFALGSLGDMPIAGNWDGLP